MGIGRYYFLILLLVPILFSISIPTAFAQTVSVPAGSSVPGCEQTNECFIPSEITVDVGATVTWTNDDTAAHTVTSGIVGSDDVGSDFDSSLFMAGTSFDVTFDTAGTYPYNCMVHPWMVGTVVVQQVAGETAEPEPIRVLIETSTAIAGKTLDITVTFTNIDGSSVEHVNYDIMATQGTETILDDTGVHDHDGVNTHTTMSLSTNNVVNIVTTFNGFGIDLPFTGPVGQVATKQVSVKSGPQSPEDCGRNQVFQLGQCVDIDSDSTTTTLTVNTDQSSYVDGEIIQIFGFISKLDENVNQIVTLITMDPFGNVVSVAQIIPDSSGAYFTSFHASSEGSMKTSGDYKIRAQYGEITSKTSFSYTTEFIHPPPPEPEPAPEPEPEPQPEPDRAHVSIPVGTSAPGCEETNECFIPFEARVSVGGTVTWSNDDSAAHTVTSGSLSTNPDGVGSDFDSSLFMAGTSFDVTFDTAGTFPYFCMVHPWMLGQVIVGDGSGIRPPTTQDVEILITTGHARVGESLKINVVFTDGQGNSVEHVNYDIRATQRTDVVLDDRGVHDHDGRATHTTASLQNNKAVQITVTFQGFGIDRPFTGPTGEKATKLVGVEPGNIPPTPPPPQHTNEIEIPRGTSVPGCEETNRCFIPFEARVRVGETVSWFNADSAAHTVTSGSPSDGPNGIFDSGLFMAGTTFEVTFDEDATYDYFCMVHPWMVGTVIVGEGGPVTPIPTPTPPPPTPRPVPTPVDTTDVIASRGSSVPGCEESNTCFIPFEARVRVGETVSWFNADSAAHTVTSGDLSTNPDNVGLNFDSSLFMAGTSFDVTFDTAGTYPYFCMVHPWMTGIIVVGEGGIPTPPPTNVRISVESDQQIYDLGDLVEIDISISGIHSSEQIAITVTDRAGVAVVSRTITTDSSGHAELEFRIPDDFRTGAYLVSATSSIDGKHYKGTDVFKIKSQFNQIRIISVDATNQQGQPSDFKANQIGFVKVVLDADKDIAVLITVNLFDSELTTIGIGSLKTTLNEGNTEMILSFMIPADAALGDAEIFVSAFSDWPSDGGVPLTHEAKAVVDIE